MLILGLETSCDETSVALLEHRGGNRLEIRANLIASQIEAHQLFGGVVPEIASRKHLEAVNPLLKLARETVGFEWRDLDLIAVTRGPGLSGALLVGVAAAKALALATRVPCLGVNHIEGHICSAFLQNSELKLPMLSLVVSGGHTDLVLMRDFGVYERLGRTRDDAVGEAFDKIARALGLPLPGGPNLEKAAQNVETDLRFSTTNMAPSFDFSYSGLKTAAAQSFKKSPGRAKEIAAAFQNAALGQLRAQVSRALDEHGPPTLGVCGGVASNGTLRTLLRELCAQKKVDFVVPEPILCTDNAAMIAVAGFFGARRANFPVFEAQNLGFEVRSVWPIDQNV